MNRSPVPVVYFFRPVGAAGPIKVGRSHQHETRLQQCMEWSPVALEVAATYAIPDAFDEWGILVDRICSRTERRFHIRYAEHRLHHEWFKPHPTILADIEAIRAGTFDIECLPEWRNVKLAHLERQPA